MEAPYDGQGTLLLPDQLRSGDGEDDEDDREEEDDDEESRQLREE